MNEPFFVKILKEEISKVELDKLKNNYPGTIPPDFDLELCRFFYLNYNKPPDWQDEVKNIIEKQKDDLIKEKLQKFIKN